MLKNYFMEQRVYMLIGFEMQTKYWQLYSSRFSENTKVIVHYLNKFENVNATSIQFLVAQKGGIQKCTSHEFGWKIWKWPCFLWWYALVDAWLMTRTRPVLKSCAYVFKKIAVCIPGNKYRGHKYLNLINNLDIFKKKK